MEDYLPQSTPSPPSLPPPLPSIADGKFHHVDPNLIPVGRISMSIGSFVLIMIGFFGLVFFLLGSGVGPTGRWIGFALWFLLFPVLGVYSWVWPAISYRRLFYCLKEDCLIIRRGVFWKSETMVPKTRIQHTDISQGPLQRGYGISELVIHTAGTRFALVTLSGLSQDVAPRVRNHLLDRTNHDDSTL